MLNSIIIGVISTILTFLFAKFAWKWISSKIDTEEEMRLLYKTRRIAILARDYLKSKEFDGPFDDIAEDLIEEFIHLSGVKYDTAERVLKAAKKEKDK